MDYTACQPTPAVARLRLVPAAVVGVHVVDTKNGKIQCEWRLAPCKHRRLAQLRYAGRPSLPASAGGRGSQSGRHGARQGRQEQPVLFALPDQGARCCCMHFVYAALTLFFLQEGTLSVQGRWMESSAQSETLLPLLQVVLSERCASCCASVSSALVLGFLCCAVQAAAERQDGLPSTPAADHSGQEQVRGSLSSWIFA